MKQANSATSASDGAEPSLTARIRERYGDLSPLERQLADVILACPGELSGYSATELAGRAGVSKMTVSRLVRRLGYAGFEEARLAARRGGDWGSPLFLLPPGGPASTSESDPAPLEAHFQRSAEALAATARQTDPALLAQAARALADARRIWVCGARNSAFLAGYARWQFIQVRGEVHQLAASGETMAETLADLNPGDRGPGDLLFLVGIRRRPPAIVRLLRAVRERAIPTILIADSHSVLEAPPPPLTFRCETRSLAALDTHVAALAVIHALAAELIPLTGPAGRARIRAIEDLHEQLGEL
ncbi:MurR/RpiR family transcriptional regulator (plasmid) [Azospirillum oryzae]|uniref:MurR/RpiR family transcriptional regulator n=1 Tax=Azospirillum oryzae TaxID=286727 RepID=A0A6N1AEY8_9PROT|nr:MurR/RpiR family transcriptional regulator [Azospirillum oryzae]KAA0588722.1 MurR/RpiR family transcriptional regulator [Azospirillum oryzae]QKS50070.1 MurR/RpiR family transcriptional regulator [Azospirillum oryzae]GLR81264.1 transcriptional regulator [Azospirillum oryzae]